jgi:hypothetical protein
MKLFSKRWLQASAVSSIFASNNGDFVVVAEVVVGKITTTGDLSMCYIRLLTT